MKIHDLPAGPIAALTIAGGTVRVGRDLLEASFPARAFAPFLGDAGITIRDAQLVHVAGAAVVRGTASLAACADPAADLANPLLDGAIAVVATLALPDATNPLALGVSLRFALPAPWKFSDSFPDLELIAGDARHALDLDTLSLSQRCLYLNTHAGQSTLDDGSSVALEAGLGVLARWNPEGMLWLLQQPATPVLLHGPVVRATDAPLADAVDAQLPWDARHRIAGLHLQADLGAEVPLPPGSAQTLRITQLGVRIHTPLVWQGSLGSAGPGPSMAYVGDLLPATPGAGRLARITAVQQFGADARLLLTGGFDGLTGDALLAALQHLAGGKDAARVLPGAAAADEEAKRFALQRACITLARQDGGSYAVESTSLRFGRPAGGALWAPFADPLADLVRIGLESAEVTVVWPFDSQRRAVLAAVRGDMAFLQGGQQDQGLKLHVTASYPGFYVTAAQQGATRVHLGRFGPLGLQLPTFLDVDLDITDIAFVAEPGVCCAFSMNLAPRHAWTIGRHALRGLALAVSCETAAGGYAVGWKVKAEAAPGNDAIALAELVQGVVGAVAGLALTTAELPPALQGLGLHTVEIVYSGKDKLLGFACTGKLALDGGHSLVCGFTVEQGKAPAQTQFGGRIQFDPPSGEPLTFTLQFCAGGQAGSVLVGTATSRISLAQALAALASKLGMANAPPVPDFLDIALGTMSLYWDTGRGDLVLSAATQFGSTAVIVFAGKGQDVRKCAVLLDKHLHIGLSSLPLVSDKLAEVAGRAGVEDVGIESLQVVVSYGVGDPQRDVALLNGIIDAAQQRLQGGTLPRIPRPQRSADGSAPVAAGPFRIDLGASYYLADKPQPALPFAYDAAPPADSGKPAPAPATAGRPPAEAQSQAVWFDVQRSFGVVSVKRLGIACVQGEVHLLLDAALVLSGLTMELQGLALAFPVDSIYKIERSRILESLRANAERMSTHLDGLALSYTSGPVSISGGLLAVHPPPANTKCAYEGALQIQAAKWTVSAVGSFAELDSGGASLFAFGHLNAILGGPAFFFVTGVAAGFGYNRSLTLPALDAVARFPLIAACTASDAQAASFSRELGNHLYPAAGQHWIAAGVRFTSFRMIDSFALFTVSFGERFELALTGLSTLTLPAPPKPGTKPKEGARPYASMAHAQLALQARYAPDDGVLKIAAQLTPESYILSRDCHLSGGFALHTWFQDERVLDARGKPTTALVSGGYRAGDFVLSIGGYHPAFTPPGHFPSVPRVAANWQVNESLSIKASLYFALTPLAIMTGGALDASFASGSFKAWFHANVDFLLYWEPLGYQAKLQLIVGASYTMNCWTTAKTITAQVGVDLELYGPPFGGRAVVDLYVCSFPIDLGPRPPASQKLEWSEFEERLLPKPASDQATEPAVCLTRAAGGLIQQIPAQDPHAPPAWCVNPETFAFATSSAIPCSEPPRLNGATVATPELQEALKPFGVRPCEFMSGRLRSEQSIEWLDEAGNATDAAWQLQPVAERLPGAFWGPVDQPPEQRKPLSVHDLRGEQMTAPLVTGFTLRPRPRDETHRTASIAMSQLPMTARTLAIDAQAWSRTPMPENGTQNAHDNLAEASRYTRLAGIDAAALVHRRSALRAALAAQEIALSATPPTTRYLADAVQQRAFRAAPLMWRLGRMQPS